MDAQTKATLSGISTATLTTVLLKKGLRNVWLRGAFPRQPGQTRVVGTAFTLRFVPAREDLATPASWASPISTRTAIEAMEEGVIAVADAMGVTDAGIFGDILCARMAKRKVAALITDGVMRDMEGVLATGIGFPTVAKDRARVRTIVTAAHTRAELDRALEAFRTVGKRMGLV